MQNISTAHNPGPQLISAEHHNEARATGCPQAKSNELVAIHPQTKLNLLAGQIRPTGRILPTPDLDVLFRD